MLRRTVATAAALIVPATGVHARDTSTRAITLKGTLPISQAGLRRVAHPISPDQQ